jgi:hypothetical protein
MLWSKLALYCFISSKKRQFFADFFGENIFKIITSVPGHLKFRKKIKIFSAENDDSPEVDGQFGWRHFAKQEDPIQVKCTYTRMQNYILGYGTTNPSAIHNTICTWVCETKKILGYETTTYPGMKLQHTRVWNYKKSYCKSATNSSAKLLGTFLVWNYIFTWLQNNICIYPTSSLRNRPYILFSMWRQEPILRSWATTPALKKLQSSLARFKKTKIFSPTLKKRSSLLQRWRCSCKF